MKKTILLIVAALALCGVSYAAEPTLRLKLNPSETLPGIPVDFIIEAENPNETAIRIGRIILEVEKDSHSFIMVPKGDHPELAFDLPPHGSASIRLSATPTLDGNVWFHDTRLNRTGNYRLRLHGYDVETARLVTTTADITRHPPLTSASAVDLNVRTPQKEDADVWALVREKAPGIRAAFWNTAEGRELATKIWDEFPHSEYAASIALLVNVAAADAPQHVARLRELHPATPLDEWHDLYLLNRRAEMLSGTASTDLQQWNELTSAYQTVAGSAPNSDVQKAATAMIAKLAEWKTKGAAPQPTTP